MSLKTLTDILCEKGKRGPNFRRARSNELQPAQKVPFKRKLSHNSAKSVNLLKQQTRVWPPGDKLQGYLAFKCHGFFQKASYISAEFF